jgi:hypothetical protein
MHIFAVKGKKKCRLSNYIVENSVKIDLRKILFEAVDYLELNYCPIIDM